LIEERPIGAGRNRNLGSPTAPGEIVEAELDRLIEKRAALEDPEAKEELWVRSVERYNARRREENRFAWCEYFSNLAGYLRARAEEYDHRAKALLEDEVS
jgi:hypothetical protein